MTKSNRNGDEGNPQAQVDRGLIPELVKRAVNTSIQTIVTTEEGVRSVVGAVAQNDVVNAAVQGIDATRKEVRGIAGREIRTFLENLNVGEELAKILTSVSFEIRTEVRFVPNEDGTLRAKVRGSARPKVNGQEVEAEDGDSGVEDGEGRGSRRAVVRSIVERFAEATAATARAAAEVAAEAALDVVNESQARPSAEPEPVEPAAEPDEEQPAESQD